MMKFPLISILACFAAIYFSCTGSSGKKNPDTPASPAFIRGSAQRFKIEKSDSCSILTIINPWQGAQGINQVFYLLSSDQQIRKTDSLNTINVPVEKIVCMSSTHVAMIRALGKENAICGISGTNFIYDTAVTAFIKSGRIAETGYDAGINKELILSINPDLIMMYGVGSESESYVSRITGLGVKILYNADYLETDPLAKAEWIKVFGALFCEESRADSIYNAIASEYNTIKKRVAETSGKKPVVLLGLPYRDTWYISPGNSYICTLINDAGGDYLWKDVISDFSMPYSIEAVYLKALKADYWLNIGTVKTREEIASFDARLTKLPAYTRGNLFNNTGRLSEGGGNDYWESGTLNPHILLKDLASILNPSVFGNYDPVYYRKIY